MSAEAINLKAKRTDTVTTWLTPEQKEKLKKYAEEDGRSISGMIRKILIDYIYYRETR